MSIHVYEPPAPVSSIGMERFEQTCWEYAFIWNLPFKERQVALIFAGWHAGFNKRYGRRPRLRGDGSLVAEFLGVKPPAVSRRRGRARRALKRMMGMEPKDIIQGAFNALREEMCLPESGTVIRWRTPFSVALYTARLISLAGELQLRVSCEDLLIAAKEYDFAGQPEKAIELADDLEQRVHAPGTLSPETIATLCIEKAVFFDHLARESERERRPREALDFVERGRKLLKRIVRAHPKLDGEATGPYGDTYWRASYHLGVLTRRVYQLRHARNPHDPTLVALLTRAKEAFKVLLLQSDRIDHRIAAAHQDAVCDMLLDRIDEAEAGFRRNLKAWDYHQMAKTDGQGEDENRFRRAYEHRGIAHIFIRRARAAEDEQTRNCYFRRSLEAFQEAVTISTDCGFVRYIIVIQDDARSLLPEPFSSELTTFIAQHIQ